MDDSIILMISSSIVSWGCTEKKKGKTFTNLSFNGGITDWHCTKVYLQRGVYYGRIYKHGYGTEKELLTREM